MVLDLLLATFLYLLDFFSSLTLKKDLLHKRRCQTIPQNSYHTEHLGLNITYRISTNNDHAKFFFWGTRQLFFLKGEIRRKFNFYLVNTAERDEIIGGNQYLWKMCVIWILVSEGIPINVQKHFFHFFRLKI